MTKKLKMRLQFFAEDPPAGDPPAGDPPAEEETPAENDIATMLLDIQGLLANMQEAIDKLAPVSEEPPAEDPPAEDPPPEDPPAEEEINEIDKILQED